MHPSDVSATPAPDESVTGPAFALALMKESDRPVGLLQVVNVGYDGRELETWYQLELAAGRLAGYLPVAEITHHGSATGGVWDVPAGVTVFPGMKLAKSSTR